jgi:4-hydroxyproline epimerase
MSRHTFFCVDAHTAGNPVRVVVGGAPPLTGATMSDRRQHFIRDYDWIRTGLMFEPRGHDVMSGSVLYAPTRDDTDAAIVFIETSGCLPMCGHGTIGTITVLLEEGLVTPKREGHLRLEVPAGIVEAEYTRDKPRQRRQGAHPQRAGVPLSGRAIGRGARLRSSRLRHRLWRQLLRHH